MTSGEVHGRGRLPSQRLVVVVHLHGITTHIDQALGLNTQRQAHNNRGLHKVNRVIANLKFRQMGRERRNRKGHEGGGWGWSSLKDGSTPPPPKCHKERVGGGGRFKEILMRFICTSSLCICVCVGGGG